MADHNEKGIKVGSKEFAQNGLLAISIIGGFVFTALILVLQGQENQAVRLNLELPNVVFGVSASDVYFLVAEVWLGGLTFLCVLVSMAMLLVSSANKAEDSTKNLSAFVNKWTLVVIGTFGGVISWLIIPYHPFAAFIVLLMNYAGWLLFKRVWDKDEKIFRPDDNTKTKKPKSSSK